MSRSGLFALIIIAVLTVAGGVYWYMEFVPLSGFGKEQVVQQPVQPQAPSIAKEEPAPTPTRQEPMAEPGASETLPPPTQALIIEEEPVETTEEPLREEPQLYAEEEVEVTIIPIDDLEHFFETGLFELSTPAVQTQIAQEEPALQTPETDEEPIVALEEDEALPTEEEVHFVIEEAPVVEEPAPLHVEEEVAAATTELLTARLEKPTSEPKWEAQISLGIPHWQLPAFTNSGFAIDAQFFRWTSERLRVGGSFGGRSTDGTWNLDLLGGVSWTVAAVKNFSFPVTLMAGPSVRLGSKPQFGLLGRASVGLSYQLLEKFSVSLETALLSHWNVGEKVGFALEAPRISFSLSF